MHSLSLISLLCAGTCGLTAQQGKQAWNKPTRQRPVSFGGNACYELKLQRAQNRKEGGAGWGWKFPEKSF